MESTFKDFKMIMEVVLKYLNYQITVFGTKLSIMEVIISCLILSIAINLIIQILIGLDS